ncbi:MAG: hypothetical protein R3Y61_00260 [Rikenellaceae bacterium]
MYVTKKQTVALLGNQILQSPSKKIADNLEAVIRSKLVRILEQCYIGEF